MGWPEDNATTLAMHLWNRSEDYNGTGVTRVHNYIAITWPPGDLPPFNSFKCGRGICHVQAYSTEAKGINALVQFLNQSSFNMLDTEMHEPYWKGKLEKIYYLINGLGFCGGCQNGKYPIQLYDYLAGHIRSQPSNVLVPGKPIAVTPVPVSIFTAWHDLTRQITVTIPRELRRIERDRKAMLNLVHAAELGRWFKKG